MPTEGEYENHRGGLSKTGTTSLAGALTTLGFTCIHSADIGMTEEILALIETGQVIVFDASLNSIGSVSVDEGALALDVGDLNRDGNLDLAVANLGDELIELLTGDWNGQFAEITRFTNVDASSDLVVTDINGDGFAEIAVTNFQRKTLQTDGSFVDPKC